MSQAKTLAPVAKLQAQSLFKRLSDPQVWVCAIAAFTLVGLSSGLLGAADTAAQSPVRIASALPSGK